MLQEMLISCKYTPRGSNHEVDESLHFSGHDVTLCQGEKNPGERCECDECYGRIYTIQIGIMEWGISCWEHNPVN